MSKNNRKFSATEMAGKNKTQGTVFGTAVSNLNNKKGGRL